jgi:hypothetical protein
MIAKVKFIDCPPFFFISCKMEEFKERKDPRKKQTMPKRKYQDDEMMSMGPALNIAESKEKKKKLQNKERKRH